MVFELEQFSKHCSRITIRCLSWKSSPILSILFTNWHWIGRIRWSVYSIQKSCTDWVFISCVQCVNANTPINVKNDCSYNFLQFVDCNKGFIEGCNDFFMLFLSSVCIYNMYNIALSIAWQSPHFIFNVLCNGISCMFLFWRRFILSKHIKIKYQKYWQLLSKEWKRSKPKGDRYLYKGLSCLERDRHWLWSLH